MSVKILEGIEDSMRFNDKYFPRVDIKDPRYKRYKYKGKLFVYDTKDCLVILLFQDDEEVENLGKDKAPWREMESAGLRYENWKNKEIRNEYLDEWIWEMDDEADRLADDFIKYELPYMQEDTDKTNIEDDTYGTQMDVVLHLPYYDDDEDMKYFTIHVDANSEDEAIEKAKKYIKAKKTSKNAKIWKDAEVHEVKTY